MHLAGHYYHVYNRGCNREPIFANDGNYLFLLRRAQSFLADYPLSVIAYCLMPNHSGLGWWHIRVNGSTATIWNG